MPNKSVFDSGYSSYFLYIFIIRLQYRLQKNEQQ